MTHDELAADLAASLRTELRMVWTDMQLGPAGSPRPDVYTMYRSYARPAPVAYEIKVSKSDYRADVTAGKWQTYLQYAGAVYFACEDGLISPKELPEICGLTVRKEKIWRIAKRPISQPVTIPQDAFIKLVIDGVYREGNVSRAHRRFVESTAMERVRARFGDAVADTVRDLMAARLKVEELEYSAKYITERAEADARHIIATAQKQVEPARVELATALGLPENTPAWKLAAAVTALRGDMVRNPAEEQLRMLTSQVQRALDVYGADRKKKEIVL